MKSGIEPPPVIFKIWKFLNRMVEALGITIDRRSKGRPRKKESQNIEKNRAYLFKLIIFIRSFGYINKSKRKFKQEKKYGNTKY